MAVGRLLCAWLCVLQGPLRSLYDRGSGAVGDPRMFFVLASTESVPVAVSPSLSRLCPPCRGLGLSLAQLNRWASRGARRALPLAASGAGSAAAISRAAAAAKGQSLAVVAVGRGPVR